MGYPGNQFEIGLAVQAAKGTAATAPLYRQFITDGNFGPNKETADVEETASGRLRSTSYVSRAWAEGSPVFACRPSFLGLLLWGGMGAKTVTGAADPYTHTFTLANVQPYMTLWRNAFAALFERFTDVKVRALNFASDSAGILQVTADMRGLSYNSEATTEPGGTTETTNTFLHADGRGQFMVEGVAAASVRSARVNIALGVSEAPGAAITDESLDEGMQEITFETEQTVQDFALWNRYHYGTASPADGATPTPEIIELGGGGLDFKWTKRTAAGVAATPERSLQFTATRVQIAAIEGMAPNTGGDPITRTVRYKVYAPASGSGLTAVLKNGVASYAAS